MTRRDALLRLHKNLLASKDRLGKTLRSELAFLHDGNAANGAGDSADLAFEADGGEISSRLAELGDRELDQVEQALSRWKQDRYGICVNCQKPISLLRLNALPYAPFCINFVREMEKPSHGDAQQRTGNWSRISDAQAPMHDQRASVSEMEMDLSASWRG
jgi:RNA polymerase-binding transcription factor